MRCITVLITIAEFPVIRAIGIIGGKDAATFRITGIIGTGNTVITAEPGPGLTIQICVTGFDAIAYIAVITQGIIRLVGTGVRGLACVAPIPGAPNAIAALYVRRADNQAASVSLAGTGVVHAQLPHMWQGIMHHCVVIFVTAVIRALISVIKDRRNPGLAPQRSIARLGSIAICAVIAQRVICQVQHPVFLFITAIPRACYPVINHRGCA
jgi:hypothetical protein